MSDKQLDEIRKAAKPLLEGYVLADRETDQQARERLIADALKDEPGHPLGDGIAQVYKEVMKLEFERFRKRAMEPSAWVKIFPPISEEIIDDPERQEC